MRIHIEAPISKVATADDWKNVAVCNNFLNSLWKTVEFWIGDRLIHPPYQTYGHKTNLEKELGKSDEIKNTLAASGFWFDPSTLKDPESFSDFFNEEIRPSVGTNQTVGREFGLLGKVHLPLFEQRKLIPGGLKLKLRFLPNDPSFYIKCANTVRLKQVEFTDCSLRVKGPKLSKHVADAIRAAHLTNTMKYFLKEVTNIPTTITKGTQDIILDNVHNGQIPNRAFVYFVDHRAHSGSYLLNPYNYQHFKVNHIALYINGTPVGGPAKTPNYTNKWYTREYNDLFEVTNQDIIDTCITIKKPEFAKGRNLFSFRCQPDLISGGAVGVINPIKKGHFVFISNSLNHSQILLPVWFI